MQTIGIWKASLPKDQAREHFDLGSNSQEHYVCLKVGYYNVIFI